jgi:hypothetical protein
MPALPNTYSQALQFNAPYFGKGADAYFTYTTSDGISLDVHVSDQVALGRGVPYTTCSAGAVADPPYRCQTTVQNSSQTAYTTRIEVIPAINQPRVANNQRCAANSMRDPERDCTATMQFSPVISPTTVTIKTATSGGLTPGGRAAVLAIAPGTPQGRALCVTTTGNRPYTCKDVKLYPGDRIVLSGGGGPTGNRSFYGGSAWAELSDVRPS